MQMNTRKNAFEALFYLVWTIMKQQWKIFVGVLIVSMIIIPLPKLIGEQGGYINTSIGLLGLFYTLPVLTITLICLPMIHNQIYSSSIKKRLNASGVPSKIYALVMITFFALVAMVVFYGMAFLAWAIWNGTTLQEFIYDVDGNQTINEYLLWNFSINWLALLLLTPIAIFGLSATGLLIGRIELSEIIKGVIIFLFIIIAIGMSRTIFNPMNSDMALSSYSNAVHYSKIFVFNPWGSMIYTMQHSFDQETHSLVKFLSSSSEILNPYTGITDSLMSSTISSIIIFSATVAIF